MQANSVNHSLYGTSDSMLDVTSNVTQPERQVLEEPSPFEFGASLPEMTQFRGHFENVMEMYSDAALVAQYLDEHSSWFRRCAQPMTAEPIGSTGYALIIGRFGSFGYEVEPKIGLDLLPQDQGVYRIRTIPVPGYQPVGYDVDFQASLELVEKKLSQDGFHHQIATDLARETYTSVEWELDLTVTVHFPRFIQALPQSLIQNTGDRLLQQIVRQVSKRLTQKVQEDFHATMDIPFSRKRRALWS